MLVQSFFTDKTMLGSGVNQSTTPSIFSGTSIHVTQENLGTISHVCSLGRQRLQVSILLCLRALSFSKGSKGRAGSIQSLVQSTSPRLLDPIVGSIMKNMFAVGGGPEFRGAGDGALGLHGTRHRGPTPLLAVAPMPNLMTLVAPAPVLQVLQRCPWPVRRAITRSASVALPVAGVLKSSPVFGIGPVDAEAFSPCLGGL